jgi:excisionase family DNA binding protein
VLAAALREHQTIPPPTPQPAAAMPPDQPLTVPEVAKSLRVRQSKVVGWIRAGKLQAFNVSAKANGRPQYRITCEALAAFQVLQSPMALRPPPAPRQYRQASRQWV